MNWFFPLYNDTKMAAKVWLLCVAMFLVLYRIHHFHSSTDRSVVCHTSLGSVSALKSSRVFPLWRWNWREEETVSARHFFASGPTMASHRG